MFEALTVFHDDVRIRDARSIKGYRFLPDLMPVLPALHDGARRTIAHNNATLFKLDDGRSV